mgnify:CR=1 FL=1
MPMRATSLKMTCGLHGFARHKRLSWPRMDAGAFWERITSSPITRGRGGHICNCGYAVDVAARGQGVARAMCLHSQEIARDLGFLGMQFNLVVSTNAGAIGLWLDLGFGVVGTVPGAFRPPSKGPVDAHVMFKALQPVTA